MIIYFLVIPKYNNGLFCKELVYILQHATVSCLVLRVQTVTVLVNVLAKIHILVGGVIPVPRSSGDSPTVDVSLPNLLIVFGLLTSLC